MYVQSNLQLLVLQISHLILSPLQLEEVRLRLKEAEGRLSGHDRRKSLAEDMDGLEKEEVLAGFLNITGLRPAGRLGHAGQRIRFLKEYAQTLAKHTP